MDTRTETPRRRYDKELIRERTLELLTIRLGPGKDQGARLVWDCPACGKPEKYSVVKALGKGGCLVADCRLAGSSDVFVMLANLDDLDFQADFLALLAKSYELLGLEAETGKTTSEASSSGKKTEGRNSGANSKTSENTSHQSSPGRLPVSSNSPSRMRTSPRSSTNGRADSSDADSNYTQRDIDSLLELAAKVYERILEICPLESRDRGYLREERGISNETIRKARFGTMTVPRARKVKAQLEREFGREELLKIPGFSQDEEHDRLKFTLTGSYILIPYHDANGRITTIEGRCVGDPPKGKRKYVTLRRAGNHLYLFPGHRPEQLLAICEGVMGAVVAADSGLAVGSIMGCERFKASPSPEMLDGGPEDPLLELKDADFGGRMVPYIPDADDPPNPNVLRAAPKAAHWIAEPQNGKPAICLLPEGADLDEWLLQIEPDERGARFAELLATAHPPEDAGSLPVASPMDGEATDRRSGAGAAESSIEEKGAEGGAERIIGGDAESPETAGTTAGSPGKNNRPVLTAEDVIGNASNGAAKGTAAHRSSKRNSGKASGKQKSKSKSKGGTGTETKDKAKNEEEPAQPGLWEESSGDVAGGENGTRSDRRSVSAGARKTRDEVYQAIIELLPQKDDHLDALEKKGIIRETAHYGRFASLDAKRAREVVPKLVEQFGANKLVSVPGFEIVGTGDVQLSMAPGSAPDDSREYLLLPCFDAEGKLAGLEGLAYYPENGELEAEETVPLKGAGSHLYVFAHYKPNQLEGLCEGPLGALLAASDDVVIGATGGFRRYKAASGPGEGRQAVDAVLPELEGVDFGGRQIAYAPRSGTGLEEANARYHEVEPAARWLIGRQNGNPAVVGIGDDGPGAENGDGTAPTSLGEWILSLGADGAKSRLRELFPEAPVADDEQAKQDHNGGDEKDESGEKPKEDPGPSLPSMLVYGAVGMGATAAAVLDLLILRLRDFAGYVSVGPNEDAILYSGALGPVRELADSTPFQLLYSFHALVSLAAALTLTVAIISKSGKSHRAKWRAERMRLEERWDLHLTPARAPSKELLTTGEVLWPVFIWPVAYLLSGWLILVAEAGLSLAVTLQMVPEFGADLGTLVENPTRASLYAATTVSAFVLYRRRSIRAAHNRMLQGKIRH